MAGRNTPSAPKPRWRRWLVGVILAGTALAVLGAAVLVVIILRYGATDRARPADVIVVLGGGASGTERRTRHGAALYHQGYAPAVLCTGGAITGGISEAERCARLAQDLGVPGDAISQEATSRSTEENAIQVAGLMRQRGWRDAVLVSDDFHLWRAQWLFERQGVRVWPSPAQITDQSIETGEKAFAVGREVLAIVWQVGKSLLGLSLH
jgi:uncharacterized SAM-binding protein YcdF (DUF218 family)